MTPLTDEEIAEARRLDAEATPGPWEITYEGVRSTGDYSHQIGTSEVTVATTYCATAYVDPPRAMVASAKLICRYRSLLPRALAELVATRAERDAARAEVERLRDALAALAQVAEGHCCVDEAIIAARALLRESEEEA